MWAIGSCYSIITQTIAQTLTQCLNYFFSFFRLPLLSQCSDANNWLIKQTLFLYASIHVCHWYCITISITYYYYYHLLKVMKLFHSWVNIFQWAFNRKIEIEIECASKSLWSPVHCSKFIAQFFIAIVAACCHLTFERFLYSMTPDTGEMYMQCVYGRNEARMTDVMIKCKSEGEWTSCVRQRQFAINWWRYLSIPAFKLPKIYDL